MEDMNAEVEPLPLVPAMWIGRNFLKSEGLGELEGRTSNKNAALKLSRLK
jgi:hypothetical protein